MLSPKMQIVEKRITILILDEVTYLSIKKDLEQSGINYSQMLLSDSSFTSLNELAGFCEVTVETDNIEEILKIIDKPEYKNHIQISLSEVKNQTRPNYFRIGLIAYSLIITFLFAKYWHIDHINSSDKNFVIKWNPTNTRLDYIDKKNDKTIYSFVDDNYDLNYEKQLEYYQGDGPISIRYDEDENGYYERVEYFALNGTLSGLYLDSDQDGLYEMSLTFLESGDTIRLKDSNSNGLMEMVKK